MIFRLKPLPAEKANRLPQARKFQEKAQKMPFWGRKYFRTGFYAVIFT